MRSAKADRLALEAQGVAGEDGMCAYGNLGQEVRLNVMKLEI